ncbi:hypothetical protein ALP05_05797 [Pseudomonas caricapapayae]|uniref:Uncharacterized protein n=1 Tax=Pseudomonas caricapapayae TaxID=46678 RepID=A0A3M6FEL6_9PSED|nr:hypothetical protein ALP05_05797 [Pseudomonas caricapapayae]
MAITAALCKLQNVIVNGSPLNGGPMEKILQRLCVLDDRTLPPQLTPCVTPFHAVGQAAGQGGEA